jgi:hypothetical protein
LFLSKGDFGLDRGKVVFLYNLLDLKRTTWEGPELGAGKHTIVFDFKSDGPGLGKGGTGVLSVDVALRQLGMSENAAFALVAMRTAPPRLGCTTSIHNERDRT